MGGGGWVWGRGEGRNGGGGVGGRLISPWNFRFCPFPLPDAACARPLAGPSEGRRPAICIDFWLKNVILHARFDSAF